MRNVFVIGTLHAGLTPLKELDDILIELKPDQIMVEIQAADIKRGHLRNYPPEMIFAFKWAKKMKTPVAGFDCKINILKEVANENELLERQTKIIKRHNWKDFNKTKFLNLLGKLDEDMIDWQGWNKRQHEMLKNIYKRMMKRGNVVILTGCGHVPFFRRKIKNAKFPLV